MISNLFISDISRPNSISNICNFLSDIPICNSFSGGGGGNLSAKFVD